MRDAPSIAPTRRATQLLRAAAVSCSLLLASCNAVHLDTEAACEAPAVAPAMAARGMDVDALRIISWNLNGTPEAGSMRGRIRHIAAQVLARRPDVVLLQEVWFEGDARMLEAALAGSYARIGDAPAVRSHFLSPFTGFRAGGLLAFVSTEHLHRADGTSQFERFDETAPWYRLRERDGIAGKGVQHFLLQHGERRIAILNTHLQAQYAGTGQDGLHRDVRARQIEHLRRVAERLESGTTAVVAAGDINTVQGEADLYRALTSYWTDLTREARELCDCGTHIGKLRADGTKAHGDRWIDYVLVRTQAPAVARVADPRVELIHSESANCRYSDHHGLDVVFSLR